jgi:hypothetical protein
MADGSQVGIGHWNERFNPANESNVFVNNIVAGCYRNFYHGDTMKGLVVANNTFYNSTLSEGVMIGNRNQVSGEFRNNIILQENNIPCITIENNSNIILSNNLYNKTYSPKASGIGDIVSDPLIKKTGDSGPGKLATGYFALLNGSPAIDAGFSMALVLSDINGFRRDSRPDIGAMEYNSTSLFVKISAISIATRDNLKNLEVGDTLRLFAEIMPADASVKTVNWSLIGNPQSASVSSSGLLTAISHGIVTVLALANDGSGVSASINIFIYPEDSDGLPMQISPIPATDVINISLNKNYALPLAVRISDVYGRIIIKYQVLENNFMIKLPSAISAGLYFVQLCSDNNILETRKLIVLGP